MKLFKKKKKKKKKIRDPYLIIAMQYNIANISSESEASLVWSAIQLIEAPSNWSFLQSFKDKQENQ